MLELSDVAKRYRRGREDVVALDGVDLEVAPGEFVAITGASGSGKSTLMNILGCLDRPTAGVYRFEGRDISSLSRTALAQNAPDRISKVPRDQRSCWLK